MRTSYPVRILVLSIALAAGPAAVASAQPCSQVTLDWPADEARVQVTELDVQPLSWSGCAGAYQVQVVHPDGTARQTMTTDEQWNFRRLRPVCTSFPCPDPIPPGPPPQATAPAAAAGTGTGSEHAEDSGWYTWRVRPCNPDCATGTWHEASFLAVSGALVEVEGGQFVLGSLPFRFVGANLRGIIYHSTGEMDEQLQAAYSMGARVVRVWLFRNDRTPAESRQALNTFLGRVAATGSDLRVIVTFIDLYGGSGFHLAADQGAYGADTYLDRDWFIANNPNEIDYMENYHGEVETTVVEFAGRAEILAWELGNELRSAANGGPALEEFASTMRTLIHEKTSQMVTGGFVSSYHAYEGLAGAWHPAFLYTPGTDEDDYFDFMTIHGYDLGWRSPGNGYEHFQQQAIDYLWAIVNEFPYVVEEFGFTGALSTNCDERQVFTGGTWGSYTFPSAIDDRGPAVTLALNRFFDELDASGVMQWGFMFGGENGEGDKCAGLDTLFHTDYFSVRCAYQLRAESLGVPVDGSCAPSGGADLAVSVSASDGSPTVGDRVTLTFGLTNLGSEAATGIVIGTTIPPGGLVYVSHGASVGAYSSGSGDWNIPILASGASATLTVTVDVVAAGFHLISVSRDASSPFDPSGANDLAQTTVFSEEEDPPTPSSADLAVSISASSTSPTVGDRISYSVQVTDLGPDPASGIVIGTSTNSTPAGGLSYVSHSTTAGSYTPATGNWSLSSLGAGATASLTITVDVIAAGSHVTTAARTTSSPMDPTAGNDTASVIVTSVPSSAGCAPSPGSQELMRNGAFWGDEANWHLTPPPGGSLADVGVETCCSQPPGGYPNAFAHPTGAGGITGLWQDIPNAQAGDYRLEARVRTSAANIQAWIQTDNGNPSQTYCSTAPAAYTSWTRIDCCFSLASPSPLHVAITASNSVAGSWAVWDDVSLTGPAPSVPRRQVEASGGGAFYVDGSGAAKTWGSNNWGQFGNGSSFGSLTAVASGFSSVRDLGAGNPYTCSATASGGVQCSGFGSTTPSQVTGFPGAVVEVATAGFHHCARLVDGRVYCWGQNGRGQLGNGTTAGSSVPVAVQGLNDAVQIAVGDWYSCAVRENGLVACWGGNERGQLGDGTTADRLTPVIAQGLTGAVQIDADYLHTCAVTADLETFCWGRNDFGQLGDGTTTDRHQPVDIGLADAVQIGVGNDHTCARLRNGWVACWGSNEDGQLGIGNFNDVPYPTLVVVAGGATLIGAEELAVGGYHACVVGFGGNLPGTVSCWGDDDVGQLGNGSPAADRNFAVAVSGID